MEYGRERKRVRGNATAEVLNAINMPPHLSFTSSGNDAAIYYLHKQTETGDEIYFVSNGLRKDVDVVLDIWELEHRKSGILLQDLLSG